MNILHIIPTLGSGGAEKMLLDIVEQMTKKGCLCEVAVLTETDNFFAEQLSEIGIEVYYGPSANVYSLKNIVFIKQLLQKKKYDIVHTHLFGAQLFTPIAQKFVNKKIPLITTEHSTHNKRRDNRSFLLLDFWMYRQYEKIIAITEETKETLIEYLPSTKSKIIVIENGINLKTYKNAKKIDRNEISPFLNEQEKIVVMVAAMREQKDHETLIRASKYLPKDYRVIFVGDGERMTEVKKYALIHGSENILFLGKRTDIPQILKAADLFVLSSKWEGFGLVALEAAACGLPVIASDVKGLSGVVKSIGGEVFVPYDEIDLSNKIKKVMDDKRFMNSNLEKYSIETTVERYLMTYTSCNKD